MGEARRKGGRRRPDDAEAFGVPPGSHAEILAYYQGQMAMLDLQAAMPGRGAIRPLHALRVAARLDPSAAYNLGNFLAGHAHARRGRRLRSSTLFGRCVEMGLDRLPADLPPYPRSSAGVRGLRDVVSFALTNIGGQVANRGAPERAVPHFRDAIRYNPGNANAHVCLGNMAVHESEATGLDPLDGIASWREAGRLGDYCHESASGCGCRANVVSVAEGIACGFGDEAARSWVARRYALSCGSKSGAAYMPVVADLGEVLHSWPGMTVEAESASLIADAAFSTAARARPPLETKVSLAGSLLACALCHGLPDPDERVAALDRALAAVAGIEPLKPFLGDEDWEYRCPPQTDHVTGLATHAWVNDLVLPFVEVCTIDGILGDRAGVAAGILFHLDAGFRRGVASMVRDIVRAATRELVYVPAVVVGDPPRGRA